MEFALNKLYGKDYPNEAVGLDQATKSVYSCIRNTVVQRRGHQCVLLGARATGKSLVVHHALNQALSEFPDEFLVVKINGLVHSEDRLALREIAKQLDRKIDEGDLLEKPSMTHTLRTLNRLFEVDENDESPRKSVVFVVDELEQFATIHQVLAYELLDWSQSSLAGVAVIGTSTRMNVLDLLEKRNRSRNPCASVVLGKPESPEKLASIGKALLAPLPPPSEQLLQKLSEQVFYTSNSARHLAALLVPYVLNTPLDTSIQLTSSALLAPIDCVPELDLALLICSARACIRFATPTVNLVIVMDEWRAKRSTSELALRASVGPGSLQAVRYAWDRLRAMGLLEPVNAATAMEDQRMFVPELDLDDLRDLLPRTHVLYGWTSM